MKYQLIKEDDILSIYLSGDTRENESLILKSAISPYLKGRDIKVIVNLKKIEKFELITLIGVLNSIKKETTLLRGELKLCSLNPEIINYFKANRLDHFFQIYEDEGKAKNSSWRNYEK